MSISNHKAMAVILSSLVVLTLFFGIFFMQTLTVRAEEAEGQSESAQAGIEIFEEVNCLMCHLLNGEGGGLEDAPDLAGVSTRLKPDEMAEWLEDHLYEEPRLSMFEEDPTDEDIRNLTDYLQTL